MENQVIPALEVEKLSHRFGKTQALSKLSFAIAPGQIVGLLGRNGAGKSTLLRIISGQLKAKEGDAWLFGQRVYNNTVGLASLCMISRHRREVSNTLALSTLDTLFRRRRASSKARRPIRSISSSE